MVVGTIDDFSSWMSQAVSWYPFLSYDKYGDPQFGSLTTIYCYQEVIPRLVKNQTGQEVVSARRFYTKSAVNVLDKLVIAGVIQPPIIRVDRYYNDRTSQEFSVINL